MITIVRLIALVVECYIAWVAYVVYTTPAEAPWWLAGIIGAIFVLCIVRSFLMLFARRPA